MAVEWDGRRGFSGVDTWCIICFFCGICVRILLLSLEKPVLRIAKTVPRFVKTVPRFVFSKVRIVYFRLRACF